MLCVRALPTASTLYRGLFFQLDRFLFPQIFVKITAVAFMVHFFSHVAAVTIDPADASVRAKQSYSSPMPLFDRSKQSHVIQDLHCYLCDVKVYVFAVSHRRQQFKM